jgi:hypothetical protein
MNQKGDQKKWRRSGERKKKDKMEKGRNWGKIAGKTTVVEEQGRKKVEGSGKSKWNEITEERR